MIQHRRAGQIGLFVTALFGAALLPAGAQTILSNNLSSPSGGADTATGTNWLTASFNTNASAYTLNNVTLLLANTSAGAAEVDIYADGGLQPGTLLGTLASPGSYSATLANTTFTTSGLSLAANSTYWTVLKANSGSFDLSFANDDSSTGSGFTDTYGNSPDAGATWFTFQGFPYQMSVTATATAVPEPGTIALLASGSLFGAGCLLKRRRTSRSK